MEKMMMSRKRSGKEVGRGAVACFRKRENEGNTGPRKWLMGHSKCIGRGVRVTCQPVKPGGCFYLQTAMRIRAAVLP